MSANVYLLIYRPSFYDDPEIIGVFSARALAEAHADGHGYEVAEMALDARRVDGIGLPFAEVPWDRPQAMPTPAPDPGTARAFANAAMSALAALAPITAPSPGQTDDFGLTPAPQESRAGDA